MRQRHDRTEVKTQRARPNLPGKTGHAGQQPQLPTATPSQKGVPKDGRRWRC